MLFVSHGCLGLTGYSPEDLIVNRTVSYAELMRPSDKDRVWKKVQQGLEQRGSFEVEYRIVTAEGEEKHVWEQGSGIYEEERLVFLEGFINDITERKQAEERIYQLAYYDDLTDLPNRRLFYDRLKQVAARSEYFGGCGAVFLVDITRLRTVNDTLGQQAGDELIREVARRMGHTAGDEDTVARVSGGEFMVLSEGRVDADTARNIGLRILEGIGQKLELSGRPVYPEVNIGFTLFPERATDPDTLIKQTDIALSEAKKSAHSIQGFAGQKDWISRQFHLEHDLKQALTHEEFFLCYQSQIDLRSGRIVGLEALLRWEHPERGVVSPGEFIPVLEQTGMIAPVEEWVIHRVCEQLKSWQERGALVKTSVNLSAQEFNNDAIIEVFRSALEENDLPPGNLEVEITETGLMENVDRASRILQIFSSWGVTVALDDFGKGYSCMSYLQKLAISTIKIDKEFVLGLPENEDSVVLVQTIIAMAHNMGKEVLAEGVEHEGQRQKLCELGCDYGQGFLWSRPQRVENLPFMGKLSSVQHENARCEGRRGA
jgi:diguanylate cyclase (GGDEF)-like protein/PAS domain S-box-containing protein